MLALFLFLSYHTFVIPKKDKEKILEGVRVHEKDTGSPEAQIGLLSAEIERLLLHLKRHAKDMHSKRGLLRMVAKRRRLLAYLKKESPKRFSAISRKLGLKQTPSTGSINSPQASSGQGKE